MSGGASDEGREVVCPHCKKTFTPEPLEATAVRHQGFKCPHCRLFVASDRADKGAAQA
jgi:DNA-directed RNA polymerase subunit RPC12/RpoP